MNRPTACKFGKNYNRTTTINDPNCDCNPACYKTIKMISAN